MSAKTSTHASRTIVSALIDLRSLTEELAHAHDALTLPDTDDVAVDWCGVLASVDALGSVSSRLATTATKTLIPVLKTLKRQAQGALDEIARLEHQFSSAMPTEAPPSA